MIKKKITYFLSLIAICICLYGVSRLYFKLTGGFMLSNIQSDFTYHPAWDIRELTTSENEELKRALNQPYAYLGKGCQSYVFVSEDQNYVIKFFKYQRFRLQSWLAYFPPLPAIAQYRVEKMEKKAKKLDGFMLSWKTAFDYLKEETGLLFVHLNKTKNQFPNLKIIDKIRQSHQLDLDQMEFCVQRRADMLCTTLLNYKEKNDLLGAQSLIQRLLMLIMSEYSRGLADNDHALMQNTGVAQDIPLHIDVGQFEFDEKFKDPLIHNQEILTKTYKFKGWLKEAYPELALFLDQELEKIIGPNYKNMKPKFREKHA